MQGIIKLYSRQTRTKIRNIIEEMLAKYNASHITENVLNCLDEFIKNGLKANYKYLLIRQELKRIHKLNPFEHPIEEILQNRKLYNEYCVKHVDLKEISNKVRHALNQEAKLLNIKNKAKSENRRISPEEKAIIASSTELLDLRKKMIATGVKVHVRIEEIWGSLEIEVVNNAPILDSDLERIHDKRAEFQKYVDTGEEHLFFINNIDNMDGGAGLGYATVDAHLNELNIDPKQAIHIISITNTTILMSLKISKIKELSKTNPN